MRSFIQWLTEDVSDVEFLVKNCSKTDDPSFTSFLLPDGTRLHTSTTHDRAAGYRLTACLKAGVVRYSGADGIEVAALPTWTQARIIADDFHGKRFFIDFTSGRANSTVSARSGTGNAYREFDPAPNASVLRAWVAAQLDKL